MKKYLLFFWGCCYLLSTEAQNKKLIDSLSTELTTLAEDTNKVLYLCALAFEYRTANTDSAFLLLDHAVLLAEKLHDKSGLALAYNHRGILYKNKQQFSESITWHTRSLQLKTELKDQVGMASSYNNLGRTYGMMNDQVRAVYYYIQSLRLREKENDVFGIGASYNNISHAYANKQDFKKALPFALKALQYMEAAGDSFELAKVCGHIGFMYYELNQFERAVIYLQRARQRFKEAEDINEQAEVLITLGNILVETGKKTEGLGYLIDARNIVEQNDIVFSYPSVYLSLGQVYGSLKQQKLAIQYSLMGLQKSKELKLLEAEKDAYEVLSNIYSEANDYKNALTYFRLFESAKDAVIQSENTQIIEELQTQYQTQKKDFELKKTFLELENAVLENNKKKTLLLVLSGSFCLLLLLAYLFYNRSVLQQKAIQSAELLNQQELRNKTIIEAEEKERIRIARELHDGIGQQLSAAKMNLSAFEQNIISLPATTIAAYQNLISLVDDAVKEVRSVSHNMMPNALIRSGLASAIRDFVNKLSNTDALKFDLQIVGLNDRMENTTESVLYRVLQECVSNIVKHAEASQISIQLIKHSHYLNMIIEDNGKGFDTQKISDFEGIGLKNIVSRIQFLNGTVDFDSYEGRGTSIIINVPL